MPLNPGDILASHYRIEAEIGRGAYGRVYRALDTKLDRLVAIKELAKGADDLGSAQFADYVRRFEREAKVQANLNHPNIVHVYELIEGGDDQRYLVMEYVDGENLRDTLARRGPLPVDEAVRITADILAGLSAVHADPRDIVHRDIKPSNVLLTKAGQAKLADFGLAQVGDESMRSEGGKSHPGTQLYMSPEQGSTSDYLYSASDIFSVGCVLFEMLTGIPYKHARRDRKELTGLRPDAPPWLKEIVTAALAKDPDDRPANAAEMGRMLAKARAKVEAEVKAKSEAEALARQEAQRKAEEETERARLAEQERQKQEAEKRAKQAATLLDEASRLRTGGNYVAALDQYRRAKELIPSDLPLASEVAAYIADLVNQIVHPPPVFRFRGGDEVTSIQQLVDLCAKRPVDGAWHLMVGHFTPWLKALGRLDLSYTASDIRQSEGSPWAKLQRFLDATAIPHTFDNQEREEQEEVARALAHEREGNWHLAAKVYRFLVSSARNPARRQECQVALTRCEAKLADAERQKFVAQSPRHNPKTPAKRSSRSTRTVLVLVGIIGLVVLAIWHPWAGEQLASSGPVATIRTDTQPTKSLATPKIDPARTSEPTKTPEASVSSKGLDLTKEPNPGALPNAPALEGTPVAGSGATISASNSQRVEQLARWGKGRVATLAHSNDGRLIAMGSSLGIYLADAWTFAETRLLETDAFALNPAFSPDGKMLAVGDGKTIRVWRVDDGALLQTLKGHQASVYQVTFLPDGQSLLSAAADGTVRAWQIQDGQLIRTLKWDVDPEKLRSVAVSSDAQFIAVGSDDGTVRIWQATNVTLLHTLLGHKEWVDTLAFSPDSQTLASGSADNNGTIQLWGVKDGTLRQTLNAPSLTMTFSPDGRMLAIGGGQGGAVQFWDVANGSLRRTFEGHTDSVTGLSFSPDGTSLVSSSQDFTVRTWKTNDGALLLNKDWPAYPVNGVAFAPDGSTLAVGAGDTNEALLFLRAKDGVSSDTLLLKRDPEDRQYVGNAKPAFSLDGALLAAGSNDGTLRVWNATDHSNLWTQSKKGAVVAFSPDRTTLASAGGYDNSIRLWQGADGILLRVLDGHTANVMSLAFSPDGTMLASGGGYKDNTVRLWRVSEGAALAKLDGHSARVDDVAFSPDGRLLASAGTWDGTVRLWTMPQGTPVRSLQHPDWVRAVAFSRDGSVIATGCDDGLVRLWQTTDGALLQMLKGHTGGVFSVAWSPDGRFLASGSADGTTRLWGVR